MAPELKKYSQADSCIMWARSPDVAGTISIIGVLMMDLELVSEMLIDLYHLMQLLVWKYVIEWVFLFL